MKKERKSPGTEDIFFNYSLYIKTTTLHIKGYNFFGICLNGCFLAENE